jgi:hypothetical protein
MCFIHLDESAIHVSKVARSSHLCVLFAKKFDSLLDCMNNRCMMHDSQNTAIDCWCGNRNNTRTVAARCHPCYKYLLHSVLMTISHSPFLLFFCLGFNPLALGLLAMEDKRGNKRSRSPSPKGSPSPSDTKTPPPTPFGSKPSEVSSRCPYSPMFEQGGLLGIF